jgi:hypothetical protein
MPKAGSAWRLSFLPIPNMKPFNESFAVIGLRNAVFFASELFYESFSATFPVPRENCGLPIPTPPEVWRQYVALYKWPDGRIETVGFCNWIRYEEVYLEGGMCVRSGFYRRLPREHWQSCKGDGGVAEIMMRSAALELTDCTAWFGYCGDKKAYIVDMRVGYEPTKKAYLIAKWSRETDAATKDALIDKIARIGPF